MNTEIYVSTQGNDTNPGTRAEPVATLAEALRRMSEAAGGHVVLMEGTHYLDETAVLGPDHSGTESSPLVIRGEAGARPVISGGRRIECTWEEESASGTRGLLSCDLSRYRDAINSLDLMYVDGRRQIKARYPSGDSRSPSRDGYMNATGADAFPHSEVYFNPEETGARHWKRPEEAVLHIFPANEWGNTQYRLRGVDFSRGVLQLDEGGYQIFERRPGLPEAGSATGIDAGSRFFVENVFEELDAPGEWYLDKRSARLFWIPEPDVDPKAAVVEFAVLPHLIELSGTLDRPVEHVEFRGLGFAHAASTFLHPYITPSAGDWALYPGGALRFEASAKCVVHDCEFIGLGGNAVYVSGQSTAIVVSRSTFADIGESAVCLVGESHMEMDERHVCPHCGDVSTWGWGEPSRRIPSGCVIEDNLIHDIGVFGKQTAGVFMALSCGNVVRHNHIYDTPRAAICINDGLHGGHVIEWNDIHDTVRETGDHGPFNSWGREGFWCHAQSHGNESHAAGNVLEYATHTTVIRNNRFRDASGWGIDLDDGSSNYHVHSNLCIGISVKLREGDHRLVENNIFFRGANPPGIHRGYEGNCDRFVRNIVVSDTSADRPEVDANFRKERSKGAVYDLIHPPSKGPWFGEWDHNLFWSDIGHFLARVHFGRDQPQRSVEYGLDDWQRLGHDRHSRLADPCFADPESGDFRLAEDSPALALGFKPFPLDRFGIRRGS